ncbi:hypothetical protein AMECASPLE_008807 [Ameca splendens]|uniref:Uncharacterized protein n=1 Tax=Ameca splendens TaxID=208324 RepID=A0ABV0XD60_9TELE
MLAVSWTFSFFHQQSSRPRELGSFPTLSMSSKQAALVGEATWSKFGCVVYGYSGFLPQSKDIPVRRVHGWLNDCKVHRFCECKTSPHYYPSTTVLHNGGGMLYNKQEKRERCDKRPVCACEGMSLIGHSLNLRSHITVLFITTAVSEARDNSGVFLQEEDGNSDDSLMTSSSLTTHEMLPYYPTVLHTHIQTQTGCQVRVEEKMHIIWCGEEGEVKGEREVVVEEEEGEKGERGGDSPAAFRHNERIMADGPRCKRRKQANPRRTNAPSIIPSTVTSFPVPAAEKHPHSMIVPPPCFSIKIVYSGCLGADSSAAAGAEGMQQLSYTAFINNT